MSANNSGDSDNAKNTTSSGQAPTSTSNNRNEDQDLLSTFRRLADEHISAALHSVFGIPSTLHTPSSSNWIVEENERQKADGLTSRREGGDDPKDDDGKGSGGSGMSGFGGDSGSSAGGSSSGAGGGSGSNNRDRGDEDGLKIPLWTPTISQVLLSLGLHSTALLERNFGHFHKEFQRLLEEEQKNIKKMLESPESEQSDASNKQLQRIDDNTPKSFSETVIVRGTQTPDDPEPKYTVERYTNGKPNNDSTEVPSIWRELFGEDMHGPERKHPLFTSFFDEFLPEGRFGRDVPPTTVGGWRASRDEPMFPDPFESLVRMMISPTLRRLQESGDERYNDGMRSQVDRIFQDVAKGKAPRDLDNIMQDLINRNGMGQGGGERLTDEQRAEMKRQIEEFKRQREEKEGQWREHMEGRKKELARLMQARQAARDQALQQQPRRVEEEVEEKSIVTTSSMEGRREPETELDLHNYFHGLSTSGSAQKDSEKVVVAQSTSTTTTTDANGITRTKRVRERRFSDGSIEREEQNDEAAPPAGYHAQSKEGWGGWGEYGIPKRIGARSDELRQAFKDERERSGEPTPTPRKEPQDDGSDKNGGWGSWLWASGRK